jgi:hypothetical protein
MLVASTSAPRMRVSRASALAVVISVALPATGQPVKPSDELLVGEGVTMSYAAPRTAVILKLRSHLCPPGSQVLQAIETSRGLELTCFTVARPKPSALWACFNFLEWLRSKEQATAWGRVKPNPDPSGKTVVEIGVALHRGKERIFDPDGHFFNPTPWAQRVWHHLEH